jgi:hypothetical protein
MVLEWDVVVLRGRSSWVALLGGTAGPRFDTPATDGSMPQRQIWFS